MRMESVTDDRQIQARRKAEKHWPKTGQRDTDFFKAREKQRLADEAKTARLRALRLEKEAAEKAAAAEAKKAKAPARKR